MTPDLPPVEDAVAAALIDFAAEACEAEQVDVHWTGVDAETLGLVEVEWHWLGDPCRERPTLRLVALGVGGEVARLTVRPQLTVWVRTSVAAHAAHAGDVVNTERGLAPIHKVRGHPVTGAWRARVDLDTGDPVTDRVVETIPDASSGATVDVVVRRGSLEIRAEGRLLQDAVAGDDVRFVNTVTKVAQVGVLIDPNTVELR